MTHLQTQGVSTQDKAYKSIAPIIQGLNLLSAQSVVPGEGVSDRLTNVIEQ